MNIIICYVVLQGVLAHWVGTEYPCKAKADLVWVDFGSRALYVPENSCSYWGTDEPLACPTRQNNSTYSRGLPLCLFEQIDGSR
jgi:hypothetical protein